VFLSMASNIRAEHNFPNKELSEDFINDNALISQPSFNDPLLSRFTCTTNLSSNNIRPFSINK
jgi:hypothetical protein